MSKPINLSAYADRTVDFMIGGRLFKFPELSYRELKKINEYEKNDKSTTEEETEIVLWLLNRNTAGKKFTQEDLDNLPAGAVARFYQENARLPYKALVDPN